MFVTIDRVMGWLMDLNVCRNLRSSARFGVLAALLVIGFRGDSVQAYVEMLQLSASNIDEHVTADAGKLLVPGDVLLRNENVQVAVLTSSTKADPYRAGRCVPLTGASMMSDGYLGMVQPGPAVTWIRPEAGQNDDLAVVKFRHDGNGWRAELTIRIRSAAPGIEIATRLFNRDEDKTLQIPVVDIVANAPGVTLAGLDDKTLKMSGGDSTRSAAYFPFSPDVNLEKSERHWSVGLVSNDPAPGIVKRVSRRILALGRNNQTFEPIEASRDWDRVMRDQQSWFRVEHGQQRNLERRLVLSMSESELPAIVQLARQENGTASPERGTPTTTENHAVVVDAPNALKVPQDKGSKASVTFGNTSNPVAKAPPAPSKIVGKLRVTEAQPQATRDPLPPLPTSDTKLPSLPEPVEKAVPAEPSIEKDDEIVIPEIDAIEDLPAPE